MPLLPNSIEGKAAPYLGRVENLMKDLESKRGEYMAECKVVREDIKEIYSEAKANGVPAKALKGLVRYRELERKQAKIGDGLDIDEGSTYQQLVEALGDYGDTPLGAAALGKAPPEDDGEDKPKRRARKPKVSFAPAPEDVKAATEADNAEKVDVIDRSFADRIREHNDGVAAGLKDQAERMAAEPTAAA